MQNMALSVDVCRQQKKLFVMNSSDEALVAGGLPAGAGPGAAGQHGGRTRQIVFLDTLAQDVGEALALLRQGGLLAPKPQGGYVRLADIGEILEMIEHSRLLPLSEPDWYLRLLEFTKPIV
jgi:hypothetical protein